MFIYLTGSNLFVTSQWATNNSNRGVTPEVLGAQNTELLSAVNRHAPHTLLRGFVGDIIAMARRYGQFVAASIISNLDQLVDILWRPYN